MTQINLVILIQIKLLRKFGKRYVLFLEKKFNTKMQRLSKKKSYLYSVTKKQFLIQKFNKQKTNNIFAGDWTQNDLPCTIEASILSGKKAIESL